MIYSSLAFALLKLYNKYTIKNNVRVFIFMGVKPCTQQRLKGTNTDEIANINKANKRAHSATTSKAVKNKRHKCNASNDTGNW